MRSLEDPRRRSCAGIIALGCAILAGCAYRPAAAGGMQVFDADDVDARPRLLECGLYVPPPEGTRSGRATVRFVVTKEGRVESPVVSGVTRTPGQGSVENAALTAARSCTYRPAMIDGQPVAVRWSKSFRFARGGG